MAVSETKQATAQQGLVISHLGNGLAVENSQGNTVLCHTRRNLGTAAVGDRVLWQPTEGNLGCVLKILGRKSLLSRPTRQNKTKPVAANIDQLLVVLAHQPRCDFLLIDQYLVVCENRGINPIIVCNKTDLADSSKHLDNELELYREIGYPILKVSAKSGTGFDQLQTILNKHTSMLAGQSGVGKSSLTNALIPEINLPTNELSRGSLLGRHTTTAMTLYHLPSGGDLIDSPGVAVFGLAQIAEKELAYGYREFQNYIGQCQFQDCRHRKERNCAIQSAVETGSIDRGRYQRFLKLREKLPRA